jgi:hypothetical protein
MTRYWCRLLLWVIPLALLLLMGTLLLGQHIPTQEIAFISRTLYSDSYQVRLLDVSTRVSRPLGIAGLSLQWQPEDTLFIRGVSDLFGAYLWQDDTRIIRWPYRPIPDGELRHAPTGDRTLFLAGRRLWYLGAQQSQPQLVTAVPGLIQDVAWSPDGERIAITTADAPYRLSILEAACLPDCQPTSALRMIENDTLMLNVHWRTPHEISFSTLQTNGECNLDALDIRSRIRTRLMPYNLIQCRALWTADGSAVYYLNELPMPGLSIYRWEAASGHTTQLYQDANTYYMDLMGLSQDETQIFLGVGVPADIYALNVVSSSLIPLVILPTDDYGASERP